MGRLLEVLANFTPRTKPACESDTPPANSDNALSQSSSTSLTANTERSSDVSVSQDTGSGSSHTVNIQHLSDGTLSHIPDSSPVLTSDLSLEVEDSVQTLTIESSVSSSCKVPGHTSSEGDPMDAGVPVPVHTGGQTKYKNRTDAGEQKGKYFFVRLTYRFRMVPLSYLNKVRVSVPGPHGSALI